MIEVTVTQYEKHQENDIVLNSYKCDSEIEAARWVKNSWDNECDDMFGKNPIIIKKLANEIKKTAHVVIDTPYCADSQITWTIIKQP